MPMAPNFSLFCMPMDVNFTYMINHLLYMLCDGYRLRGYTATVLPPSGVICHTLYKEPSR